MKCSNFYKDWDASFWQEVYRVKVPIDVCASDVAEKILRHLVDIGIFVQGDEFQIAKFADWVIVAKAHHFINFNVTAN